MGAAAAVAATASSTAGVAAAGATTAAAAAAAVGAHAVSVGTATSAVAVATAGTVGYAACTYNQKVLEALKGKMKAYHIYGDVISATFPFRDLLTTCSVCSRWDFGVTMGQLR